MALQRFMARKQFSKRIRSKSDSSDSETETDVENDDIYERLSKSFDVEEYSDLKFNVDGKCIHVHKSYLKIVCKHFNDMFANEWRENHTKEINITQYSYEVYHSFIKYLYTKEVEINVEVVIDLYDLANSYFEERLLHECKKIIRKNISVENVCHLFTSALKHNSQQMQDICVDFIFARMSAIKASDGYKALPESEKLMLLDRLFDRSDNFRVRKVKKC